jgi:hypothetical protein
MIYSLSEWFKKWGIFNGISCQLRLRMCHYEGSSKPGEFETESNTPGFGLC